MRLLVTGGCGFIGNNFIRYWLANHPRDYVTNIDALTYAGHLTSTRDFRKSPRYHFALGNILNAGLVNRLASQTDVIVHFAAQSHVDRSILSPQSFVRTNVLGTQVILEAALKARVKRFHHVSTDEVFGALPLASRVKFTESTTYSPRSPYAASKAGSDHLVMAYFYTFKLPVSLSNSANNYGPYQDPEKFIPRMITNLLLGQKIPIYGDGKYVRDWLHVVDHCRAIESIILKGRPGETYCVGSSQPAEFNNLQIARMILTIFGRDQSFLEFVKDRPGHDRRYALSSRKIFNELKWQPVYRLADGLAQTIAWYRENSWWWRRLKTRAESIY